MSYDFVGKSFLVYTTKVGGTMSVLWASWEQYDEAKRTGRINVAPRDMDVDPEWVNLKMVAFAVVGELHDFVLEPIEAAA